MFLVKTMAIIIHNNLHVLHE
jgi:hypothetical protein